VIYSVPTTAELSTHPNLQCFKFITKNKRPRPKWTTRLSR